MSYTLADIRVRVKNKLDDTDFDSALTDTFINDTQREILNTYQLPFNEKTFSGTLSTGQYTYDLDATLTLFQRMINIRLTSPDTNEVDLSDNFVPYRLFRQKYPDPSSQDNHLPSDWTIYANKLIFSTPVDQNYTLDMDYVSGATTLTDDTDVPQIPEEFQETLVLGAYIRALEFNDDNDIADYNRNKRGGYIDQINNIVNRYRPTQTAKTTTMRISRRGI